MAGFSQVLMVPLSMQDESRSTSDRARRMPLLMKPPPDVVSRAIGVDVCSMSRLCILSILSSGLYGFVFGLVVVDKVR